MEATSITVISSNLVALGQAVWASVGGHNNLGDNEV